MNVGFFCFDGIFEMDAPLNGVRFTGRDWGIETGI